ncbi:MAG: shikimate kinase [Candidatus Heimdallarchaeota archaeon]
MKLVIIFGPLAVGKMTVGIELAKITEMKLFHNHMSIEMLLPIFDYGSEKFNLLNSEFRRRIFEEVASSDLPGLIFTYVWALDIEDDKHYIDKLTQIFHNVNADVLYVELAADLEIRKKLNKSEFRLNMKPSKKDVISSEKRFIETETSYRLNSNNDFFYQENYIKIDNANLQPDVVSEIIVDKFGLKRRSGPAAI